MNETIATPLLELVSGTRASGVFRSTSTVIDATSSAGAWAIQVGGTVPMFFVRPRLRNSWCRRLLVEPAW